MRGLKDRLRRHMHRATLAVPRRVRSRHLRRTESDSNLPRVGPTAFPFAALIGAAGDFCQSLKEAARTARPFVEPEREVPLARFEVGEPGFTIDAGQRSCDGEACSHNHQELRSQSLEARTRIAGLAGLGSVVSKSSRAGLNSSPTRGRGGAGFESSRGAVFLLAIGVPCCSLFILGREQSIVDGSNQGRPAGSSEPCTSPLTEGCTTGMSVPPCRL